LCNLGAIYDELGQKDEAQSCFERALDICRAIGYRQGQATALGGLGLCHLDAGRYELARAAYAEALVINRDIGYRRGIAINYANLGLIAFRIRDLDEAEAHYHKALTESRVIGDADGEANALQMLGQIQVERGANQEALRLYEQAATVARQSRLDRVASSLHHDTARALAALGETETAFDHLKLALAGQTQVRAGLTAEAHPLSYLETQGGAYRNMVWLCLELADQGNRCDGRSCLATAPKKQVLNRQ
jgi:tetratricopeptide (TPR) repeat protein